MERLTNEPVYWIVVLVVFLVLVLVLDRTIEDEHDLIGEPLP
jgi:hypothetical protein